MDTIRPSSAQIRPISSDKLSYFLEQISFKFFVLEHKVIKLFPNNNMINTTFFDLPEDVRIRIWKKAHFLTMRNKLSERWLISNRRWSIGCHTRYSPMYTLYDMTFDISSGSKKYCIFRLDRLEYYYDVYTYEFEKGVELYRSDQFGWHHIVKGFASKPYPGPPRNTEYVL